MNQTWNENYIFVNEKHKLQENVLEKDVLFYEGTQKLQKIVKNALQSQGLLSMIDWIVFFE